MSGSAYPGERQCEGKRTYRTKKDAKRAAVSATATLGGRRLHAYRCGNCEMFHVGHEARFSPEEFVNVQTEETDGSPEPHREPRKRLGNLERARMRVELQLTNPVLAATHRPQLERKLASISKEIEQLKEVVPWKD